MLKQQFFVTYGLNSNLAHNFSIIEAEDESRARDTAIIMTKGQFAFLYDRTRFAGQVEKFGLTEVPLQPQVVTR
jgi:hypothetical protein